MKCVCVSVSVSQSEYVIVCWVHVHLSVYWSVSSLPLCMSVSLHVYLPA